MPPSPPSSMKQCNKSATVKFHMELLLTTTTRKQSRIGATPYQQITRGMPNGIHRGIVKAQASVSLSSSFASLPYSISVISDDIYFKTGADLDYFRYPDPEDRFF